MKANELRIGNLVKVITKGGYNNIGDTISIDSISKNGVNSWSDMGSSGCNPYCGIEPIPLTEEWLLKFCAEENNSFCINGYNFSIHLESGQVSFNYGEYENISTVQYVHQLQNLYFALTGEELQVK